MHSSYTSGFSPHTTTATHVTVNLNYALFQFSHARNQGGPGERQCGSGGPQGRNRETQLQPEPGSDQYQPHPQRPGLSWRGVRRHHCTAVPKHPPVSVSAADQRQLHTGIKQHILMCRIHAWTLMFIFFSHHGKVKMAVLVLWGIIISLSKWNMVYVRVKTGQLIYFWYWLKNANNLLNGVVIMICFIYSLHDVLKTDVLWDGGRQPTVTKCLKSWEWDSNRTFKHYCMLMRSLNIDQFYLTQEMRTDHLSLCMFITLSRPFIF